MESKTNQGLPQGFTYTAHSTKKKKRSKIKTTKMPQALLLNNLKIKIFFKEKMGKKIKIRRKKKGRKRNESMCLLQT